MLHMEALQNKGKGKKSSYLHFANDKGKLYVTASRLLRLMSKSDLPPGRHCRVSGVQEKEPRFA